jgi:hypothetical protein
MGRSAPGSAAPREFTARSRERSRPRFRRRPRAKLEALIDSPSMRIAGSSSLPTGRSDERSGSPSGGTTLHSSRFSSSTKPVRSTPSRPKAVYSSESSAPSPGAVASTRTGSSAPETSIVYRPSSTRFPASSVPSHPKETGPRIDSSRPIVLAISPSASRTWNTRFTKSSTLYWTRTSSRTPSPFGEIA